MSKHTPTPWKQHGTFIHSTQTYPESRFPCKTARVAATCPEDRYEEIALASAAFIVRAVNNHEQLVSTLARIDHIVGHIDNDPDVRAAIDGYTVRQGLQMIRNLIIKALNMEETDGQG